MGMDIEPLGNPTIAHSQPQIAEPAGEERYGAGDTFLIRDVLPLDVLDGAFERLCNEVQWCTMSHRGGEVPRLVAVEGTVDKDGSIPVYRHPADSSPPLLPFSPTVELIREHVSRLLPANHPPLNHVLVQRYRTGEDYISEHADKTVDVVRGTYIVNVSLGAQRTMTLRTKKSLPNAPSPSNLDSVDRDAAAASDRTTQRIPLPHNSAFFLGLTTNRLWLHSIRPDRRLISSLSADELAFGRERISLTFRSIGTFLSPNPLFVQRACDDRDENPTSNATESEKWLIWGQGARSKTRETAHKVSSSTDEREALLRGFGEENRFSDFTWEAAYSEGFDVLHFT